MIRSHGPRSRAWHVPPFTTAACFACFALLALVGCRMEVPGAARDAIPRVLKNVVWSGWSDPVSIGAPINSTANDVSPFLTKDGLTLYFVSDRTGGVGGNDIWYSKRASVAEPWGDPVNLAIANTTALEQSPNISNDGRLLFFASSRDGTLDIFMLSRTDPNDDSCWGNLKKLGPGINTDDAQEAGPVFLQRAEEGPVNLYFNRGVGLPNAALPDIYCAAVSRKGKTLIDAVPVDELNVPGVTDSAVSLRRDGLEIFFFSTRGGNADLYTSTRESVLDPWSTPVKLDSPLSSSATDQQPRLSWDATTLLFASNRTPTTGGQDIYISTRYKIGRE